MWLGSTIPVVKSDEPTRRGERRLEAPLGLRGWSSQATCLAREVSGEGKKCRSRDWQVWFKAWQNVRNDWHTYTHAFHGNHQLLPIVSLKDVFVEWFSSCAHFLQSYVPQISSVTAVIIFVLDLDRKPYGVFVKQGTKHHDPLRAGFQLRAGQRNPGNPVTCKTCCNQLFVLDVHGLVNLSKGDAFEGIEILFAKWLLCQLFVCGPQWWPMKYPCSYHGFGKDKQN